MIFHLGMHSVSQPSDPHFCHCMHARNMQHGVFDFVNHNRINAIKKAGKNGFA